MYTTTRSRILTIRHTLCRTEWVQSCYKLQVYPSTAVTACMLTVLLANSSTCKILLLPILPNSVTCKIHGIHYPQIPLLANSTPFTAKSNYLQIQRPPSVLPQCHPCCNGFCLILQFCLGSSVATRPIDSLTNKKSFNVS